MRRPWFPKGYADAAARLRVPAGFALVAAFVYLAQPSWGSLASGLPVAAAGLWLRAWAAGHLAKNEQLAMEGPYAYTRNPLYLGTLTVAIGLAIASRNPWLIVLFAAVFVLVYLPAIELEEQHLRQLFPGYAHYAETIPMLIPAFHRGTREEGKGFRWALYRRNEEYHALLGFLGGAGWLAWKAWNP